MVVSESGAQARGAARVVQGTFSKTPAESSRPGPAAVALADGRGMAARGVGAGGLCGGVWRGGVLLLALSVLAGCSSGSSLNPVNWWHRSEGGEIAKERPAPPGADQPFPNLATVPAAPQPPDQDAMKRLTDALVADRANAQHLAAAAPLPDPSSPSASPGLFGVGSAPPPAPALPEPPGGSKSAGKTGGDQAAPAASASMPAVEAPPAPATPPTPAPRAAVKSAPLTAAAPAPAAPAEPAQAAPSAPAAAPASADQASAAAPALPAAPPPRPAVAGAPPPPAPSPAPQPAPMPGSTGGTEVVFVAGSTDLLQPAKDAIAAFAKTRGDKVISVTGYGDAAGDDPNAQLQAVNLGLARAQAVAAALRADGVPADAIRVNAEPSGRGASLRLLQ